MMEPRLNAIGIVVNDMARSLDFYRQLGVDVSREADEQPHVEAAIGGGLRLLWDTVDVVRSFDPEWSAPSGSSRMALAFELERPADVDSLYGSLTGQGYQGHRAPWDAVWGQRYAIMLDPDGNAVDLYAPIGEGA